MASKMHVQDNSVAERRLRPIYDWLDLGNNKKALQECDKVLKKTPNFQCAKALKALALLRMGKEHDCVAILDAITSEVPSEESTLQAMTLCYRDLQQLDKICRLYEAAVKTDPNNEELHTHLFMSYVRICDFKMQQQSAMTLYKLKPKNPYYCWAVMSIILQATRGEGKHDPKKHLLLLSLAERMMLKMISDNKLEAEQEVQLYLMILEYLKKYDEIVKVLDGPLGENLISVTLIHFKLPYLMKLERWSEANLACKCILEESVDKWDIWKLYIKTVFHLMSKDSSPHTNNHNDSNVSGDSDADLIDDTPEKAHEFICRLVENGSDNGYLLRGPYLARFELCSKLLQQNIDTTDLLGDTIELFIEYFRKFGHKPCCVSDLKIYLKLLDQGKRSELATRLMKDVGISDTGVPQTEQQMQRHIGSIQLSRLCGTHRHFTIEHLKAVITALSLHYQHGYESFGLTALPTDQGPADAYGLLAAHALYDLANATESYEPMFLAIVLLEDLLKNSPSNFHAKLLCVRLYHTLGGGLGAQAMCDSLDVKHLQLDSLGYIHCARLHTTGLFKEAMSLYDATLKFFSSNYKDSSDHLTFSHKYGSFIKLEEFMDFRDRMMNSLHYATVGVDRIFTNFVQCSAADGLHNADMSAKDINIDWDALIDNQDLSVYVGWDPERIEGPPEESVEIRTYFKQNVFFLKLRTSMLYSIYAAVHVARSTESNRQKCIDDLTNVLTEWDKMYREVLEQKFVPINQTQITMPLPSRLHAVLTCPYFEIISNLLELVIAVSSEDLSGSEKLSKEIRGRCQDLVASVKTCIASNDGFWNKRATMEYVVNNIEIICISVLLFLLCNDMIKGASGRKGRKRVDTKLREFLVELGGELKKYVRDLDNLLQKWSVASVIDDVTAKLESLSLSSDGHKSVWDYLLSSHTSAVKELQGCLRSKAKLLNGVFT